MPVLEFFTAAMLAISAGLKARSLRRAGLGLPPGPLLELIAAAGIAVSLFIGLSGGGGLPRWGVPAAFVLLVGSSVDHARRLARVRRRRELTESGRLKAYVNYLADADRPDGESTDS